MLRDEAYKAQEKYVENRVNGIPPSKAAQMAGYSPKTPPRTISHNPRVEELLKKALQEKGLDENYLIGEYSKGIESATQFGAKEKDLNAHAQYLKNLSYLMGYGKRDPTVAVQINNNEAARSSDGPVPTLELIAEVSALVEILKSEVGRPPSPAIYESHTGIAAPQAHPGVDSPIAEEREIGGGGGG